MMTEIYKREALTNAFFIPVYQTALQTDDVKDFELISWNLFNQKYMRPINRTDCWLYERLKEYIQLDPF